MNLNDKFSIEKGAHGFSLVEKTEVKETKDGKETGKIKEGSKKSYYGTVYQALQGFVIKSVDCAETMFQIHLEAEEAILRINSIRDEIKKEFCIDVKRC